MLGMEQRLEQFRSASQLASWWLMAISLHETISSKPGLMESVIEQARTTDIRGKWMSTHRKDGTTEPRRSSRVNPTDSRGTGSFRKLAKALPRMLTKMPMMLRKIQKSQTLPKQMRKHLTCRSPLRLLRPGNRSSDHQKAKRNRMNWPLLALADDRILTEVYQGNSWGRRQHSVFSYSHGGSWTALCHRSFGSADGTVLVISATRMPNDEKSAEEQKGARGRRRKSIAGQRSGPS